MGKELIITLLLGYIAIVSLITYILYAVDKKRAKERRFRVPEKTLLLFSFIGGAFGGYIAMFTLRHKTKGEHWYFTVINLLSIIIHIAVIIYVIFFLKV